MLGLVFLDYADAMEYARKRGYCIWRSHWAECWIAGPRKRAARRAI